MSYTIQIKNDSGSVQTWAGKEFAIAEEYTVPTDTNRIKYQTNAGLLTAIGAGDALVGNGTAYFSDVNEALNWLKGHDTTPKDSEGIPYAKTRMTKSGWHFQIHAIEFETSNLTSLYNKDKDEVDLGFATLKCYNSSDTELTVQGDCDTSCVYTVVTWEPDYDYEILGATIEQDAAPNTDVRMWVTAVPDLTPAQGGSIPFGQGGINLRRMGSSGEVSIDGRTPKIMTYNATYHTNKFEILVRHNAGVKHTIILLTNIFKEA